MNIPYRKWSYCLFVIITIFFITYKVNVLGQTSSGCPPYPCPAPNINMIDTTINQFDTLLYNKYQYDEDGDIIMQNGVPVTYQGDTILINSGKIYKFHVEAGCVYGWNTDVNRSFVNNQVKTKITLFYDDFTTYAMVSLVDQGSGYTKLLHWRANYTGTVGVMVTRGETNIPPVGNECGVNSQPLKLRFYKIDENEDDKELVWGRYSNELHMICGETIRIYDSGLDESVEGSSSGHSHNENGYIIIYPEDLAARLKMWGNCTLNNGDTLFVYDGIFNTPSAVFRRFFTGNDIVDEYNGFFLSGKVGEPMTLRIKTNSSCTALGFSFQVACCTNHSLPSNLEGEMVNDTTVIISWDASSDTNVQYNWTLFSGNGILITSDSTMNINDTIYGLTCNRDYYYIITVHSDCSDENLSDTLQSNIFNINHNLPSNLSGQMISTSSAIIYWNSALENNVKYKWSLFSEDGLLITSDSTLNSRDTIFGLNCNTNYYYIITARNNCSNGNLVDTVQSNIFNFNIGLPANVNGEMINSSSAIFNWDGTMGSDVLYKWSLFKEDGTFITQDSTYNLSDTIYGLNCNTNYYYLITLKLNCSNQSFLDTAQSEIFNFNFELPSNLLGEMVNNSSAIINWNGSIDNDVLYKWFLFKEDGTFFTQDSTYNLSDTIYGLNCNTNYYYLITLKLNCSNQVFSDSTQSNIFNFNIGLPINLQGIILDGSSAILSWNGMTGNDIQYNWYLYKEDGTIITQDSTKNLNDTVYGLTCNTNYYYSIKQKLNCSMEDNQDTVQSNLFNYFVSNTPSSFSLSLPSNGTWVSSTPLFQWNASSGTLKYKLYIDGVLKKDNIVGTSYLILPNEAISSGMHTWYIISSNGCTTQSNETRSFLVDNTQPSSFNLLSPIDNSWTTSTQPNLSWSSSIDAQSGLAKYQLLVDGLLNRDNISSTSTTPTTALSNGSHTWEIRAVDNVGNVRNSSQVFTIKIDNKPPLTKGTCLFFNTNNTGVRILNSESLQLAYNSTLEFWINPIHVNDPYNSARTIFTKNSPWSITFDVYLQGYSTYLNARKLTIRPNYLTTLDFLNNNEWNHVAITCEGSSTLWSRKIYINGVLSNSDWGTTALPTNNHFLYFAGVYENNSFFTSYFGYLDEVRLWNIAKTSEQINKNMYHISSNEIGLIGEWKFNEGEGSIAYNKINTNQNGEIFSPQYCKSPLVASDEILIEPKNKSFSSTQTPMLRWFQVKDMGIGTESYSIKLNNLQYINILDTSFLVPLPLLYGENNWSILAYDSLGNYDTTCNYKFFVDNVTPNPFNLTSPTNNEIVMFPTPNLSWQSTLDSTGGAGMKKYQLWINGVVNRDSISMNTTTVSPANVLPQGAYTWFVKAYDNVNNIRQSTETRVFYVDWEAPLPFNLISPTDNQTLTIPNPTLIWHPSNDIGSGLDRYEITISGYQPIIVLPTDTTHLLTFNLPNGNYSWFVKAFDHAGAFTSSNTNSFTINVPLPEQAATPTGTNELCIGTQTTTYSTTGANYAANYVWEITPSSAGTISGTGTTGSVNWNATFSGIAQITVKGQNIVGFGLSSLPFAVTVHPATIPGTISGSSTICLGQPTGTLTLSNYSGTILKWQKRINGGAWSDINNTNTTFFETPQTIGLHEYRAAVQNEICPSLFSTFASVNVGDIPSNAGTISGSVTVCSNQYGVTYTIAPVSGATYYQWTLPTGASGVSTTNSINANFTTSAQSGFIAVKGVNNCGDGVESILAVTVNPLPADAGTITGNATVCQGETSVTYTVPTINYATSYVWTKPNGVTGISSTNSITFNYGTTAVSGNITVKGINSCGDGVVSTKAITVNPLPANAGTISGNTTVCQGQNSVTYTVPNIANATSYLWTLPNGATGISTTNSITVSYGITATSGNITVKGTNSCGDGIVSTKAITVNPLPIAAGTISGSSTVCQGQNSVTYSVPTIPNATSYVWTLPTGATGSSITNSITVSYGTAAISGNITVKGSNSCGVGEISGKAITVNPLPDPAGTISGNATVCQGENLVTYSVPDINNATSYVWTLLTGAVGTSTTNSITVNYGTNAISGNITVKGTNSCGNGVIATKAITVNPLPAAAGTISGSANVCQGQNSVTYTVPSIANAISYVWTFPNGATGTSTTNSISVSYSTSAISGNITVKGTNACGEGTTSTKSITVYPLPDAAGIISGSSTVCQGENAVVYTISAITNATSYIWTLPTGATGTSSTNSITVNYGTTAISGNISVKGSNSCGEGDISSKTITVKNRSTNTLTETVCDTYTAPDGQMYTTSGTKTAILTNSVGCDSVITINLTVKQSTTQTLTETACNSYTAPDGQVYTTSGTKTAVLPNTAGCDSTITINLTLNQSSSSTINETACDTYTAPDGQVYTTSGTKTAIIPNAVGCDSVITINLIVNYSPVTPTIVLDFDKLISSSGSGNQWFNQNGMIPNETNQELVLTENGTYYVIVTQNDCSSDPSNSILVNDVLVQKFDKNLIVISPNPFTNQLTIKNQTSETYQYTMYNGVGQLLFKGTLESEVMLNTSDLSTGLYIIKFVNSLGQVYYKVVKQ